MPPPGHSLPYFFETGSLTELDTHKLLRLASQRASGFSCLCLQSLEYRYVQTQTFSFHMGSGCPNSFPCVLIAVTLPTESTHLAWLGFGCCHNGKRYGFPYSHQSESATN